MKGSTRKYLDGKCLLYSTKFVLIYIYIYVEMIDCGDSDSMI